MFSKRTYKLINLQIRGGNERVITIVNNWKKKKEDLVYVTGERQIDTRVMPTILLAVHFGYTVIQCSKPHLFDAILKVVTLLSLPDWLFVQTNIRTNLTIAP